MPCPARRWAIARLSLLVPLVLLIEACGSSAATLTTVAAPVGTEQPAAPTSAPAAAASAAPADGLITSGDGSNPLPAGPRDDLKIVYTGSLDLLVDDLDPAVAKGRAAVLATGGYIGASDESRNGEVQTAVITYRIPASRWEDALNGLRGVAKQVLGEKTQATEVGGQIVDLEARLRNLRASEQVLVGIAEKTGSVNDLLEVQQRISDVRGQIEQLDGQRAALVDQVAYGTLVTTYGIDVAQVEEVKAGWNPATDVDGATATMVGVLQSVVSGAIWFGIVWLPLIVVLVVALLVGVRIFRRFAPRLPTGGGGSMAGWGSGGD
jgi:uncharacterized protein DUF4349